jgi:hypothetical protein
MTAAGETEPPIWRLEAERNEILRRQRERKWRRSGLGHGAINASTSLELADLFAQEEEAAERVRLAELEAQIAERHAQDPARRDHQRAARMLAQLRQDDHGQQS